MINRYESSCCKCRARVAPGQGETQRAGDGWVTNHLPGGCDFALPIFRRRVGVGPAEPSEFDGFTEADWCDALNPNEGDK